MTDVIHEQGRDTASDEQSVSARDAVSTTFIEVVEQLTFMFGDVEDKDDLDFESEPFTRASMTFAGDVEGGISVTVPTAITADIAANILGLDAEDIDGAEMLDDALAEMLNVVCGHVIMAIAGRSANFRLFTPNVEAVGGEELAAMVADDDYVAYSLDDSPVLLGLVRKG